MMPNESGLPCDRSLSITAEERLELAGLRHVNARIKEIECEAFEAGSRMMRELAAQVVEKHYAKSKEAEKMTTDPVLRESFSSRCDILGNVIRHEIRALSLTPTSARAQGGGKT